MNTRPYKMSVRADAAAQTADRILDAMLERFAESPYDRIRLEDVALDAGVTVQTVIRRFGSKANLLLAVVDRELGRIVASREAIAGTTPAETVAALAGHYERYGELILKTYSEARLVEGLPEVAMRGRAYHVDWCRNAFDLDGDAGATSRERRLAQIVAVCDARTWHILRIEASLSAEQTELALLELLTPLLERAAE